MNYWPFESSSNDIVGKLHLQHSVNASYAEDRFDNPKSALYLNHGYFQMPKSVYLNGDFTISLWIKPLSFGRFSRIIEFMGRSFISNSQNGDNENQNSSFPLKISRISISLSHLSSDKPSIVIIENQNEKYLISDQTLPLNSWTQLSFVLNKHLALIYMNGSETARTNDMPAPSSFMRTCNFIGRSCSNGKVKGDFMLDDLKIFNRALNSHDIQREMLDGNFHLNDDDKTQLENPSMIEMFNNKQLDVIKLQMHEMMNEINSLFQMNNAVKEVSKQIEGIKEELSVDKSFKYDPDLSAFWSFDAHEYDLTGKLHLEAIYSPKYVMNKFYKPQSAVYLTSGYFKLAQSVKIAFDSSFSICVWIKPYSFESNEKNTILSFGNSEHDIISPLDTIRLSYSRENTGLPYMKMYRPMKPESQLVSNETLKLNEWSFLSFVYVSKSSQGFLYINGNCVGQHRMSRPLDVERIHNYIGRKMLHKSERGGANVVLDDLRIYKKALSQAEIFSHMNLNKNLLANQYLSKSQ
jgi:hypothetical protein